MNKCKHLYECFSHVPLDCVSQDDNLAHFVELSTHVNHRAVSSTYAWLLLNASRITLRLIFYDIQPLCIASGLVYV